MLSYFVDTFARLANALTRCAAWLLYMASLWVLEGQESDIMDKQYFRMLSTVLYEPKKPLCCRSCSVKKAWHGLSLMDAFFDQDVVVEIKTNAMMLPNERAHGLCTVHTVRVCSLEIPYQPLNSQ